MTVQLNGSGPSSFQPGCPFPFFPPNPKKSNQLSNQFHCNEKVSLTILVVGLPPMEREAEQCNEVDPLSKEVRFLIPLLDLPNDDFLLSAREAVNPGTEFTIFSHPQTYAPDFVVVYDEVMESLKRNYLPAMHFERQDVRGDDPEKMLRIFSGIITGKDDVDPARWLHSDWRCFRVQWDAGHATFRHLLPDVVSPWSIKLLPLAVQHRPSSVSVGHKRSMPFDPNIRDSPSSSHQGGTSSAHKVKLFGKYIG